MTTDISAILVIKYGSKLEPFGINKFHFNQSNLKNKNNLKMYWFTTDLTNMYFFQIFFFNNKIL